MKITDAMFAAMRNTQHALRMLPQYRSHELVRAAKLAEVRVEPGEPGFTGFTRFICADRAIMPLAFRNDTEVVRSCKARELHDPGYLVLHEDGVVSWSTTRAFEVHYSRAEHASHTDPE